MEMNLDSRVNTLKLPSHFTVGKKIPPFKKSRKSGPYKRLWGPSQTLEGQKRPPELSLPPTVCREHGCGWERGAAWGSAQVTSLVLRKMSCLPGHFCDTKAVM